MKSTASECARRLFDGFLALSCLFALAACGPSPALTSSRSNLEIDEARLSRVISKVCIPAASGMTSLAIETTAGELEKHSSYDLLYGRKDYYNPKGSTNIIIPISDNSCDIDLVDDRNFVALNKIVESTLASDRNWNWRRVLPINPRYRNYERSYCNQDKSIFILIEGFLPGESLGNLPGSDTPIVNNNTAFDVMIAPTSSPEMCSPLPPPSG